jgi:hypothetical protein
MECLMNGPMPGILCDYWTGEVIRVATPDEVEASERDGQAVTLNVGGRACYAYVPYRFLLAADLLERAAA